MAAVDRMNYLQRACEEVLIESLPQPLKTAIDDFVAKGGCKHLILERARHHCGGRKGIALAVEAYLGCDEEGNLR